MTTIENLNLPAGIGALTMTTTGADDTVVVTPGLTTGANSGTVQSSGAVPQIAFVNSGDFTANLGDGDDALVVNGSSLADTITVDGAKVAITTRRTVNYTGLEALTVNGNAGSDTFNVTPSASVAMFIDGGDPIGAKPGDLLNIIAGGDSGHLQRRARDRRRQFRGRRQPAGEFRSYRVARDYRRRSGRDQRHQWAGCDHGHRP